MSRRRARWAVRGVLAALLLAGAAGAQVPAAGAAAPTAVDREALVQQPRPFGYVIGDVLEQRILLDADGQELEPVAFPGRERLGAWFERRAARIDRDVEDRRWLVVEYQLINVQPTLAVVSLPAWRLVLKGASPAALRVPAWPVSLTPLTPREAFDAGALGELRPDRGPPLPARAPILRLVRWSAVALALELVAWLAWWWWRNRRADARLPFARAVRQLRSLDDASPQAWQVLHVAFDRAAGRALHVGTLAALFDHAPHLAAERAHVERFYQQSATLFFGSGLPPNAVSPRALAAALQRIEKRHEP